jgi:hypothetical protein
LRVILSILWRGKAEIVCRKVMTRLDVVCFCRHFIDTILTPALDPSLKSDLHFLGAKLKPILMATFAITMATTLARQQRRPAAAVVTPEGLEPDVTQSGEMMPGRSISTHHLSAAMNRTAPLAANRTRVGRQNRFKKTGICEKRTQKRRQLVILGNTGID